jgi:hypothetical protein
MRQVKLGQLWSIAGSDKLYYIIDIKNLSDNECEDLFEYFEISVDGKLHYFITHLTIRRYDSYDGIRSFADLWKLI